MFAPKAVVANAGDNVTWHNADDQDHWPAPSASNPTGWIQFRIPPDSESRGDVALATNFVSVTAATNANPVVLTLNGPAPASGHVSHDHLHRTPTPPAPAPPHRRGRSSRGHSWRPTWARTVVRFRSIARALVPFHPRPARSPSPLPYTLNYLCALHPDETGTITVNPQL